jgi:hypothetical protein
MAELPKDEPLGSSAFVVGFVQFNKREGIMWLDKFKDSSFMEYLRGYWPVSAFVIVLIYLLVIALVQHYGTFFR